MGGRWLLNKSKRKKEEKNMEKKQMFVCQKNKKCMERKD